MKIQQQIIKDFRAQLGDETVVGPFCKTSDPAVIESLGRGGFDFVVLDMEHGPNGLDSMQNMIRAAEVTGMAAIVRVRSSEDELIGMALDIGAAGVQIPQVRSAEDIVSAVNRSRFSPRGQRGVCRYVRAAGYSSVSPQAYFGQANESLVIAQIEAQQAIQDLDSILSAGGFDVLFVGPYDLSQSLGLTGQVEHPRVTEAIKDIVTTCQRHGVITGTFVDDIEAAKRWMALGVRYICLSVDMGIIVEASRNLSNAVRTDAASFAT